MFIDSHTHLYDERLLADQGQIQRAIDAGVTRMYMPNCDSTTIEPMLQLADQWPTVCFPMMGVHPCYIKENYKDELAIAHNWLQQRNFYAIGEIGLDYYWDMTFKTQQIEAFNTQIDWALQYKLPIVVHSRESTQDCINIARAKQKGALTGIFHCFSGTLDEAKQIVELGLYIGIGGSLTYKKSELPEIITQLGLSNIVLETDAPYLAPVPHRGKRNESAYIPLVATKISEINGMPVEDIARITTANAEKVFKV